MSLDVFAPAIAASDQNVAANPAADLPAGFGESFDVAWRQGTEFNNSAAYSIARERALVDYNDDVFQRTGERLPYVGVGPEDVSLDAFNEAQTKLQEKVPGLDYLTPLSEGDVNAMTLRRMAKAHQDASAFQNRETTWAGTAGTVAATLAGGLMDPVMAATAPLGGAGEAGIALRALEFAAISGGSTAASAGIGYQSREAAVPGSAAEIPGEILGATLSGAALGGAFGVLGKVLGYGAKTLPTTVRDEVNAATSEFQFHATNPFPTAAGETAARDATVDATTALANGKTVTAGDDFDIRHVADYALAAKAETPEALAMAGEAHLRPETIGETPDVEHFDAMPNETEDAASYWDRRVEEATPQERKQLGATDGAAPAADIPTVKIEGKEFADTRGTGIMLHGSSRPEIEFDEGHYSTKNYYGQGFYTTDAADVAYGYSKRGAKASGERNLFQVAEKEPVKILDAEGPITPELKDILTKADGRDEYVSQAIEDAGAKNVREVFDEIRDIATGDGVSADEIQEIYSTIQENLLDAGYRGMSHLGGLRTGAKEHHVTIYFRPEEDLIAKKTRFDIFEAKNIKQREVAEPPADPPAPTDLTPEQTTALAAEPATSDAVMHNFEHIAAANPDMEFTTQVRQPDGSYRFETQKLSGVMGELDGWETAAKEIEACAVGGALEAAE